MLVPDGSGAHPGCRLVADVKHFIPLESFSTRLELIVDTREDQRAAGAILPVPPIEQRRVRQRGCRTRRLASDVNAGGRLRAATPRDTLVEVQGAAEVAACRALVQQGRGHRRTVVGFVRLLAIEDGGDRVGIRKVVRPDRRSVSRRAAFLIQVSPVPEQQLGRVQRAGAQEHVFALYRMRARAPLRLVVRVAEEHVVVGHREHVGRLSDRPSPRPGSGYQAFAPPASARAR